MSSDDRQQLKIDESQQENLQKFKDRLRQIEEIVEQLAPEALTNLSISLAEAIASVQTSEPTVEEISEVEPIIEELPTENPEPLISAEPKIEPPKKVLTVRLNWWQKILLNIRAFLPSSLSNSLNDFALLSTLVIAITSIVLSSIFIFNKVNIERTIVTQTPSQVEINPGEIPLESLPSSTQNSEETVITENPQVTESNELSRSEEIELTPEENLFAVIKTQIKRITESYSDELIVSIQPDFLASNLSIEVSDEWNTFNRNRQEKIAGDLFRRSQQLDFKKLEILDSEGIIVARSPVVGNKMVILD
jgi:hypothetical protein